MSENRLQDAFDKAEIGVPISKAIREADPIPLGEQTWSERLEAFLPEDLLFAVHVEGLLATKKEQVAEVEEYRDVQTGKMKQKIVKRTIEVPDNHVRHRYLETAYKVKGLMQNNVVNNNFNFNLVDFVKKFEAESGNEPEKQVVGYDPSQKNASETIVEAQIVEEKPKKPENEQKEPESENVPTPANPFAGQNKE